MGNTTVSAAKISRPKVSGIYPRVRLFERLDELAEAPITWIASPPGAGKTTLVSSYIDQRKLDALWYQVDEDDAEASTFFYYVGQAARQATPRKRRELPALTPEYQQGIATFARNFFRNLYDRFDKPFVLVLDNFQELAEDAGLHALLVMAFEQLPAHGRVLVVSRSEPSAKYARLRVNNRLRELNWAQLALSRDELEAVLQLKGRSDLSVESAMSVTQGWMAGLILLLEHDEQEVRTGPHTEFNPRLLFDYFAGEVYERTDADTQKFLVKTALFPKMTVDMAEQLTGTRNAAAILQRLSDRNYFVHVHAGRPVEYQYHPLFLEFLHRKAEEAVTPVELTAARWQAADILSRHGQTEAAVDLLFAVQDWKQIGQLIAASAESLIGQGRHETLTRWLEQLPEELLREKPWLNFWFATARRPFDPTTAYNRYKQSLADFRRIGDVNGIYIAWGQAARTSREANRSSTREFAEWDRVLKELMKEYPKFPSPDVEMMVAVAMYDIVTWGLPTHPQRQFWERRFEELLPLVSDPFRKLEMLVYGAICNCMVADHLSAGRRIEQAQRMIDAIDSTLNQSLLNLVMPFYLWRADRNEEAVEAAFEALRFGDQNGVHVWDEHYIGHGLSGALKLRDSKHAEELVARGLAIIDQAVGFRSAHLHYNYGWYLFMKGEVSKAERVVMQGLEGARQSGSPFFCGISLFAVANVLYAQDRHDEARTALEEAHRIARDGRFHGSEFQCHVLSAWFDIQDGHEDSAAAHLREGLRVARENEIRTHGWWRPEIWSVIAAFSLAHGIEPGYITDIIRRNRLRPDTGADADAWPWPVRIRGFGHCELLVDDEPVKFTRKTQKKPMQLVRALLAMGSSNVPEAQIVEALWPDSEADAAHTALSTTVHRVRKLLGNDALVHAEGRVGFSPDIVWTDVRAFEALLERAGSAPDSPAHRRDILERALNLYRGHFLADDMDSAWALPLREKLRSRFLQELEEYGRMLEEKQEWEDAVRWYRRGLEVDLLAEQFYQRLMHCYCALDRRADAVEVYRQCYRVLLSSLKVEPSSRTQQIYREINPG